MIRADIPSMMSQLNALAEVFEKKPLGDKAAMVWFDTLNDFSADKAIGVLIGWPKTHTKFPAPAEVRKVLQDIASNAIEKEAIARRREDPLLAWPKTPQTANCIAGIRKILSGRRPSPVEHWRRVLARSKPGSMGYEYATAALKHLGAVEREPGMDDEEVSAGVV